MYKIAVSRFFQAQHQLPDSEDLLTKGCANNHGHTFLAKVIAFGDNKRHGMVVDYRGIKNKIDIFDHNSVNDIFKQNSFDEPATSENIAKFIFESIAKEYPDLKDLEVSICEGYQGEESSSWVTYYGEQ